MPRLSLDARFYGDICKCTLVYVRVIAFIRVYIMDIFFSFLFRRWLSWYGISFAFLCTSTFISSFLRLVTYALKSYNIHTASECMLIGKLFMYLLCAWLLTIHWLSRQWNPFPRPTSQASAYAAMKSVAHDGSESWGQWYLVRNGIRVIHFGCFPKWLFCLKVNTDLSYHTSYQIICEKVQLYLVL